MHYQVSLTADQVRAIARLQKEGHWTHVHVYQKNGRVEVEGPFPERWSIEGNGTATREVV